MTAYGIGALYGGVHTAEELIATMLTPGEFEDYAARVLEVNGFQTEAERIEEAKN